MPSRSRRHWSPSSAAVRTVRKDPASVAAYEKFLQGQFFYNRRSPGDIERAIADYKEAVALDPQYARAWAALAGAYSLQIGQMDAASSAPLRALQGEAARTAVRIDPNLAMAQARLAQYLFHVARHQEGNEHLRIATSLDPEDPLVLGFAADDAIWNGDYALAAGSLAPRCRPGSAVADEPGQSRLHVDVERPTG